AYSVQMTGTVIKEEIQSAGTDFSPGQMAVLDQALRRAGEEIPGRVALKMEEEGQVTSEELRPLLEEQLRPLLAPSTWLYIVVFATVMSGVWIVQMPFGVLCGLYGVLVFRRAPFGRTCGGDD
ncbi:MAG: hypothetical protein GXO65_03540, partial [Euryarchaeota archaeon]|nr:hypothetical protein [Euryarchaeota archaeon]